MATTSKMSIPYPASSDLVKDGATDMQALAEQVDAKSGLVLLNTTTFTAVSSQSVSDVFSANYENYLIVFDTVLSTSIANLTLRLRVSGTDASAANYNYQSSNKTGGSNPASTSSSQTSINIALVNDTRPNPGVANIFAPFLARPTGFISTSTSTYSTVYTRIVEGYHTLSTSYTGYTLIIDGGTVSGKVMTYGYNL